MDPLNRDSSRLYNNLYTNEMDPYILLSEELNWKILSYLSPKDLGSCSVVNRTWRRLAADENLWKMLCEDRGIQASSESTPYDSLKNHTMRLAALDNFDGPPTYAVSCSGKGRICPRTVLTGYHHIVWYFSPTFVFIRDARDPENAFKISYDDLNGFIGFTKVLRLGEKKIAIIIQRICQVVDLEDKEVVAKCEWEEDIKSAWQDREVIYLALLNKIVAWGWKRDATDIIYESKSEIGVNFLTNGIVTIYEGKMVKTIDLNNLSKPPDVETSYAKLDKNSRGLHYVQNGLFVYRNEHKYLTYYTKLNSSQSQVYRLSFNEIRSQNYPKLYISTMFMVDRFFIYLNDHGGLKVVIHDKKTNERKNCFVPSEKRTCSPPPAKKKPRLSEFCAFIFFRSSPKAFCGDQMLFMAADKGKRLYFIDYRKGKIALLIESEVEGFFEVDDWGIYHYSNIERDPKEAKAWVWEALLNLQ